MNTEENAKLLSFKGFDLDLKCRGFQFEIGATYVHDGDVEACASGFHACEHPLNVFQYYAPATSRFAIVEQSGALSRHSDDTKVASAQITIKAELRLHDLIAHAVKWVFDRAKPEEGSSATGYHGAASATGRYGAASATGRYGAASATGGQGAASATGDQGAASATGYQGRALGRGGNALFLVYRDKYSGEILHAWAGIVGRDGVEPDVWYTLGADGKPAEVTQ